MIESHEGVNIKRLKEAREYWKSIPSKMWNMAFYRAGTSKLDRDGWECNTIGCALGHITGMTTQEERRLATVGIDYIPQEKPCYFHINFDTLADTIFGISQASYTWNFLFSEEWAGLGNHKYEFLARLDFFLEGKFEEDIMLDEESIYERSFLKEQEES